MQSNDSYIPLSVCKKGYLYRLLSRNLVFGVFDGETGFIGIREKFGLLYLFIEYHWDVGVESGGTAKPIEELVQLSNDIPLVEHLDTVDRGTNRIVAFDKPINQGGRGWFYVDTNEASRNIRPTARNNKRLFDFLSEYENLHQERFA